MLNFATETPHQWTLLVVGSTCGDLLSSPIHSKQHADHEVHGYIEPVKSVQGIHLLGISYIEPVNSIQGIHLFSRKR